jgi:hypothetical protein
VDVEQQESNLSLGLQQTGLVLGTVDCFENAVNVSRIRRYMLLLFATRRGIGCEIGGGALFCSVIHQR